MSMQPVNPQQVVAQIRPVLERLDSISGPALFSPNSFHALCTTLGISRGLRPDLWQVLVRQGYVTDEGNGLVCITEQGSQLAAQPRRRR
jgi:hypothetical protein